MNEAHDVIPAEMMHPAVAPTPMGMLAAALQRGVDPGTLKELMDLSDRYAATEAKKQYMDAFAHFKGENLKIIRNRNVTDGPLKGKKYAELHSIVQTVTEPLSRYGLSTAWSVTKDEKDWIEVTCTLRHSAGYSESVSMGGPPDTGGAKNALQARISTTTYLERMTLKAVCGVAEAGQDDDGNQGKKGMSEQQKANLEAAIDAVADEAGAGKLWQEILAATTAAGDVEAHEDLKSALLAKRKALKAGK